jgi:hypothetical protein
MSVEIKTERWIDSERECSCSVWDGWPDPSCDVHGMDAYYGRYDSYWWGRIRLPRRQKATLRSPHSPASGRTDAPRREETR